jgi:hypothetical protein
MENTENYSKLLPIAIILVFESKIFVLDITFESLDGIPPS